MSRPGHSETFDVVVIGGGPAGLAAAIALAHAGIETALVARRVAYPDNRTTALLGSSVDWLKDHAIWDACQADAAALRVMRLIDDTHRLFRAPETEFNCEEIGLDAFGYNIENRHLVAAMESCAATCSGLTRIDDTVERIAPGADTVAIATGDGRSLNARVVVGADGRQSTCRMAAGVNVRQRKLPQAALTFNIAHTRAHRNISTEFHTTSGPCVLVPLPGERSSVVWVVSPGRADELSTMDDGELSAALERQTHSILGSVSIEVGRARFPLLTERPDHIARNRIMLIGDAAHVLPPIGAQGLNLGLRDAAAACAVIADALANGSDPGETAALRRYEARRSLDIASRHFAIGTANRMLISDFLPFQALHAATLEAIGVIAPLRRSLMRAALSGPR